MVNALNAELNPICHLLALLGAHHILHVSRIRVNASRWQMGFNSAFNVLSSTCLRNFREWLTQRRGVRADTSWLLSYNSVRTLNHALSERLICPQKERCRRLGSSYFWLVFGRSRVQTSVRRLVFFSIYRQILGYYFQLGQDPFMRVLSNSSFAIPANNRRYI